MSLLMTRQYGTADGRLQMHMKDDVINVSSIVKCVYEGDTIALTRSYLAMLSQRSCRKSTGYVDLSHIRSKP